MQKNTFQLKGLEAFFTQNPDFDILGFDFHDKNQLARLKWEGIDQAEQLHELQAYQRLLRVLLPALGASEEPNGEQVRQAADWAGRLREAGLDSAHRIAAEPEHRFLREYSGLFGGDRELTRKVHGQAVGIKARIQHLAANIHGMVASPHYRMALGNNVNPEMAAYFEDIPSYQDLFGSLNYVSTEHDTSIFSPAAYFLDLMRIADEYVTDPNLHKLEDNIPAGFKLEERRPDLFEMALTYENTNDLLPYLRIVNAVLERRIAGELGVASGMAKSKGTASTITLADDASNVDNYYQGMIIRITNGVGANQIRQITSYEGVTRQATVDSDWTEIPTYKSRYLIAKDVFQILATAVYPFNLPFNLPLEQIQKTMAIMEAPFPEVIGTFLPPLTGGTAQDGSATTIRLAESASNVEHFYNNMKICLIGGEGAGQIRTVKDYNGTTREVTVDRSWKVNPNQTTQYHLLDQLGGDREYLRISPEEYQILITCQDTNEKLGPFFGYTTIDLENIARVDLFLERTGLKLDQLKELLTQNLSQAELTANNSWIPDGFYINQTGESLPYMQMVVADARSANPYYKIDNLTTKRLDRLNRFIRLQKKLNWSFATLNWAMVSTGAAEINPVLISALAGIKRLQDLSGLSVEELCGFWYDLKTIGKGNGRTPEDPFDRIFNNPLLLNGADPYASVADIPFDPNRPLLWNIDDISANSLDATIRGRLLAALRIGDSDLTTLGKYLLSLQGKNSGDPLELTLTNLSWLYWLSKAAASLKMKIDEYLLFLGLLYYPEDPYLSPPPNSLNPSVTSVMEQREKADWLNRSTLNVYDILYVTKGEESRSFQAGYQSGALAPFINNLAAVSAGSRLNSDSFTNGDIDPQHSADIFTLLVMNAFLSMHGIVLDDSEKYRAAAIQFPLNKDSFEIGAITKGESEQVYYQLLNYDPPVLYALSDPSQATLGKNFRKTTNLEFLFPDDPDADNKRNLVRDKLLAIQEQIYLTEFAFLFPVTVPAPQPNLQTVPDLETRTRDILHTAGVMGEAYTAQEENARQGLAGFLNTTPDLLAVIIPFAAKVADLANYRAELLTPLIGDQVPETLAQFVKLLSRSLVLFKKLAYSVDEVETSIAAHVAFNIDDTTRLTFENIQTLSYFKALAVKFGSQNGSFSEYLRLPNDLLNDQMAPGPKMRALADMTGWNTDQIATLKKWFWPQGEGKSQFDDNSVAGVLRLNQCFTVSNRTGMDIPTLITIYQINNLPLEDDNQQLITENWSKYQNLAGVVNGALHSRVDNETGSNINQDIIGYLDTQKRDALVGYTIWLLNPKIELIRDPSDLYQYLLIDVEMCDNQQIAQITEGIAALQLYLQRCRMMLEPGVTDLSQIQDIWWEWFSGYRIWEANRKVFLYPENYLEPALRRNQTPEFEKFVAKLLQSNINDQNVSDAFTGYFEDVGTLAGLISCDSYDLQITNSGGTQHADTLFLFGRTNTQPYTYYYRKLEELSKWSPWEEINVTINSKLISPVYAFDKLFIFWVEIEEVTSSEFNGNQSIPVTTAVARIKYTFLNGNGIWVEPQTIDNSSTVVLYQENYHLIWPVGLSKPNIEDLSLQKVYALYVPEGSFGVNPPTDNDLVPKGDKILLIYGYSQSFAANSSVINPYTPDQFGGLEKLKYQKDLAELIKRYNAMLPSDQQGIVLGNNTFCLTPDLASYRLDSVILSNLQAEDPIPYRACLNWDNPDFTKGMGIMEYAPKDLAQTVNSSIITLNYYGECYYPFNRKFNSQLQLLGKISTRTSSLVTVKNLPGHYIFNNGDEGFLVVAQEQDIRSISSVLQSTATPGGANIPTDEFYFETGKYTDSPFPIDQLQFRFFRLSTSIFPTLERNLLLGIDHLLTISSQQTTEPNFGWYLPTAKVIPPESLNQIDFNGPYGAYFWEIFFYAPFLVADALNGQKRFDAARQWYQYIFNPTQPPESGVDPKDRFWGFLPLRGMDLPSLIEVLTNPAQIIAYNDDPFDPDAIARLRPSAYAKAVMMKYIDNLLDWADCLFAQDTRESITQATNLYVMANDLLGKRPEPVGDSPPPKPKSFNQIKLEYNRKVISGTARSGGERTITLSTNSSDEPEAYAGANIRITMGTGANQTNYILSYDGNTRVATVEFEWLVTPSNDSYYEIYYDGIPQFLIRLENTGINWPSPPPGIAFNSIDSYFSIPENNELMAYWDRVEDRLYKIRHGMNITGEIRTLAQFEPPVDVRQLIRAAAEGSSGVSALSAPVLPVPYYRFSYMIEKAKSLTAMVGQLGSSLLNALEKNDAEALMMLSVSQEKNLLDLTTFIKEQQLNELKETQSALSESLKSAEERYNHYTELLVKGLSPAELASINEMTTAMIFNVAAGIIGSLASAAYILPQVGSPFAMTYGGQQIGSTLMAYKEAVQIGAVVSSYLSQLSATMAGYERRAEEWRLQADLASFDKAQIEYQMKANQIRRQISQQELVIHQTSIRQNQEKEEFYRVKFTNQELYQWMISRIAAVYFQTYCLAFDLARSAQRAYQFELNSEQTFVNFGYWNDLKRGLLAGEGLMLALNQMEKAYLDNNRRPLEIEKTISLMQLDPKAILDLKNYGECYILLGEKVFDDDFPGHYARKIKTISISIPAVVGPYQNIKATLTQLSNYTILKPDIEAVQFLLGKETPAPGPETLRSNWWVNQQIAISRGVNDAGMFQLNFNDERYLPFEGTGAVSIWLLSMPKSANLFNYDSISDVIIQMQYTAINGGTVFRDQVLALDGMKSYSGNDTFLMAQNFSQEWYTFLHEHPSPDWQSLKFNLFSLVPPHIEDAVLTGFYFQLDVPEGTVTKGDDPYITFDIPDVSPVTFDLDENGCYTYIINNGPKMMALTGPRSITFDLGKTPDDLKTKSVPSYLDPAKVRNIVLILFYQGNKTIDPPIPPDHKRGGNRIK